MNAEALIGTVLGTCTLQQLIGQGGMGAVYLAQQSRPRRQVAVKVLLPATTLKPHQLSAFLERFRRETDAAASLEHPNIMPVHEYGERGGLAYLVMPYISGGTLRDVMEREGQLPFSTIANYLEQMAAALDFAHASGVIHRDIKPANILITQDGRLLLTDFGLVKVISDSPASQTRLTGAGAPVGTPDYMSPEQVMGEEVDGRADQYSLGIILYQMVTGTTPFQGETPMQIAAQQLHMQAPAPSQFRTDLPAATEQVIMKVLAKRPADRYTFAQQLASAFRASLPPSEQAVSSYNALGGTQTFGSLGAIHTTGETPARRGTGLLGRQGMAAPARGLFDPKWQTNTLPSIPREQSPSTPASGGLLSRTGMFPRVGLGTGALPAAPIPMEPAAGSLFPTGQLGASTGASPAIYPQATGALGTPGTQQAFVPQGFQQMSPSQFGGGNLSTGVLPAPGGAPEQSGNTIKLTGPVKVVQVPVAPGQYVTGFLPLASSEQAQAAAEAKTSNKKLQKIALIFAILIVLIGGTTGFWFIRNHGSVNQHTTGSGVSAQATPDQQAVAMANATATAAANIVLYDPLSQNIHNWPTATSGPKRYIFKNNAYHITNMGNDGIAVVLEETFQDPVLAYSLTMQEIAGNDTSPNNSFGMILCYNQQTKGNQVINTFYSFEVVNNNGGEYRFYKYDNSKGAATSPWTLLWHQNFGKEFHTGHAANSINTVKVFAKNGVFTFSMNGKSVGTLKDGSYKSGKVGMLVNLNGTEVAFSNLLISHQ